MQIAVFNAYKDEQSWNSILDDLPSFMQDIYFRPEYLRMYCLESTVQAVLFTYRQSGEVWLYPFLMQPISDISYFESEGRHFDIETAYGYGGPLSTTDKRVIQKFSLISGR
jgi:hypothetical protein